MSILATTIYTLGSDQDAERFGTIAGHMASALKDEPGFKRAVVARSTEDAKQYVILSWWDSEEAMHAFGENQRYRQERDASGGMQMKVDVETGRWVEAD
jgi:heme-degrading monooxygenase HmoA